MKRVLLAAMVGLALLPAACKRDAAIPSERENARLDSASNLLDQAPGDLAAVDERLPDSAGNENGPPVEADGPHEARNGAANEAAR